MKNTPLRDFASKSYDSRTGRAASAFTDGGPTTIEGEKIVPNDQIASSYGKPGRGSPSCKELDKMRSNPSSHGGGEPDGEAD